MAELEGLMIKKRRKQKGYTQLQLCEKIGLSHAPVHQLENGRESISLANLRAICAELGLEVVIKEKREG
jgi:transcriptional regulator with XRE-family HTH domain